MPPNTRILPELFTLCSAPPCLSADTALGIPVIVKKTMDANFRRKMTSLLSCTVIRRVEGSNDGDS